MLTLDQLRKTFGERVAVDDLTLAVEPGEVFGLLGPNGAGKSTTIGMIVGLLRPDRGTVELDGVGAPHRPEVRAHIGLAPQALAIYEELTAEENLRFFGQLYDLDAATIRQRVDELLDLTGLDDRRRDKVGTFSGGMKRRLNLAVALVHEPRLVLLDEPTAGVDPQSRNALFDIVGTLREQGRTVIYTTHYMEEAQRLCDRVGIIDHGKLLALDTVDGLINEHGGRTLITINRGADDEQISTDEPVPMLSRLLDDGGVDTVRLDRPSLESVFLSLTGRSLRD